MDQRDHLFKWPPLRRRRVCTRPFFASAVDAVPGTWARGCSVVDNFLGMAIQLRGAVDDRARDPT